MRVLLTGGSGFIGSHIARSLVRDRVDIRIVDIAAPSPELCQFWRRVDVLDDSGLDHAFAEFGPSHIIHLAAETDASTSAFPPNHQFFNDFPVNLRGTANVVEASVRHAVARFVAFSSSFVQGFSAQPLARTPPHTPYGHSKQMMEQVVASSPVPWVILRPTYVWGPENFRFFRLAQAVARGYYLHPSGRPVIRSYASIDTVVEQTRKALEDPIAVGASLFVGDEPLDSGVFVDALSTELRGYPARRIPRRILGAIATVLDPYPYAPINRFRYRHMTSDFVVDMQPTWDLFGTPSVSIENSMSAFGTWYRHICSRASR